jgi:hypothetical protein
VGGTSSFGFPDPTYFKRVKDELEMRGLKIDELQHRENPSNGKVVVK